MKEIVPTGRTDARWDRVKRTGNSAARPELPVQYNFGRHRDDPEQME